MGKKEISIYDEILEILDDELIIENNMIGNRFACSHKLESLFNDKFRILNIEKNAQDKVCCLNCFHGRDASMYTCLKCVDFSLFKQTEV